MDRRAPVDPFRAHIESLELAGGLLDGFVQMDSMFPTFLDVTRIAVENRWPTVSGLTDSDYPNIEDLASMRQISTVSKLPLPPEVMEHFGHLQCHCMMGLFTDISRAWLTIDSDIYVWAYEKGTDIAFFDGLGETIVNVGLVKPKPGVFNNFVKYLLILTTTIEVVILGVTFSSSQEGHLGGFEEMHLLPDPVFVIPTDGVTINTCACTDSGRIFLGGKDGNLYEIVYQAQSGWFGKRYKKVNHSKSSLSFLIPSFLSYPFRTEDPMIQISVDNSRHILYTLSEAGTIEIYDLGDKGTCMCRVTSLTEANMVQHASQLVQYLEAKIFVSIVQVCAVEVNESPHVNFVVVTRSGVRLYYSTSNLPNFCARPCSLHLLHIRLPPGFSAGTLVNKPSNVHKAHYKKGTVVLITTPRGDMVEKDILWCLSADPYPFRPFLAEMQSMVTLDGSVWAMEEVKPNAICTMLPCLKYPDLQQQQQGLVADPPLIVRQHMEPPRKYVILTSQGVEILMKLRPVDMLRQLLIENKGPESKAIKAYFKEQREDQACATCLILACLDSTQNIQLAEWATRAIFLYGADPVLPAENPLPPPAVGPSQTPHQYSMHGGFNPGIMSTPLPANQQHHATAGYSLPQSATPGQPNHQQQMFGTPGTNQSMQQQQFSRSFCQQQQQLGRSMNQPQSFMSPMQQQQIGTPLQQQPQFSTPLSHHQQQFTGSRFHQQHQLETSLHHSTYVEGSVIHPQMETPIFPRLQFENTLAQQQQQQLQQQQQQQLLQQQQQLQQQQLQQFGSSLTRHTLMQQPVYAHQVTQQTPVDRAAQSQQYVGSQSQLSPMNYNFMCPGYSARHNGLYLYLGRILGPIWNLSAVQKTTLDKKGSYLLSVLSREDCVFILGHLHALKAFLERNPQYSATGIQSTSLNASMAKKTQEGFETPTQSRTRLAQVPNIQQEERQSLDAFKVLVSHVCEVMGLWKILCEHQFHLVASSLSENHQTELMEATFRTLILAGHDMCSLLINSLVSSYLSDDASVDAISSKLREVCPHLYRNEDAACSKANEMLLSARNIQNSAERQAKLQGALQLCKNVAPQVNLPLICQWFASSQYYEGILELCLTCAMKLDPKNLALNYYNNKQPPGDEEGYRAYVERMQCYKEITSVLDQLYEQCMCSPYSPSVPSSPSSKVVAETTQSFLSPGETEQHVRKLIEGALNTSDELLHVAVYEWMLSKQLLGELVSMSKPSYENFIKRKAETSANATYLFDLLWKYYEKNDNHAAAAKILLKLASTPGSQVTLTERIAYLAHAGVCMRSDKVGCAPQLGVFLRELEDKLEVARLQQQILDAIHAKPETVQTREAIGQLNSNLIDITELYEKYAEPFQLWECKLAIIHCSGHHDPALVEHVWLNIIETELQNCGSLRGNSKMAVVMSKVKLLCQEYGLLPRCVPIPFLVKQLELLCCRIEADAMQVHPTIVAVGYPFVKLIQVYDSLISESDMCWFKCGREFHLHEVVGRLVDGFLNNPKVVPQSERHLVATKAEDLLTKCLIYLMSKTGTEELINMLQGVKARLSRLEKEL